MSVSRQLWTAVLAGVVIFPVAVAEAKGPKGGHRKGPSIAPGAPQGQGVQGGNWTTQPGWTQGEKKGWDGLTVPPGFENGNKQGWQTEALPLGLQKKQ